MINKSDIGAMSPITQKLDALLRAEGFTSLETQRTIGGNNQAVNNLAYMREEGERVYIFTHEPPKGETA